MFKIDLGTSTFVGKPKLKEEFGSRNRPEFPDSDRWAVSTLRIGMKMRHLLEQHPCYILQTFECTIKTN